MDTPLSLHFSLPDAMNFIFHPDQKPYPPNPSISILADQGSWMRPFEIPPTFYEYTTDFRFPLFIALLYVLIISSLNNLNSHCKSQWAFSQTNTFKIVVIIHNLGLMAFSGWAFLGVIQVIKSCLPEQHDEHYLINVVEVLCQNHSPRGLGQGYSTYKPPRMNQAGQGEVIFDVGLPRMWARGFGYFAWFLYMSKIYEFVDTLLVIAKGRRGSFLQVYHHTGALLCSWIGYRYMVPAFMVGALFNTFIHTFMVRGIPRAGLQS